MRIALITIIAINCMFFSCEKKAYGPKVKAKLVHESCASAVVQVLDPAHYNLGQSSWQQSPTTPTYSHVFAVENTCSFQANGISEGDEFYFQLTDEEEKDCAVCALWDNPPSTTQKIVVVSK